MSGTIWRFSFSQRSDVLHFAEKPDACPGIHLALCSRIESLAASSAQKWKQEYAAQCVSHCLLSNSTSLEKLLHEIFVEKWRSSQVFQFNAS